MHYSEGKRSRGWQGWGGWMALLAQWTWVWANSGRWWRTGKPGVLQSTGSQRLRHNWATEQLNEHVNDKKTKQSYCWYGESLSGLERRSNQPQPVVNSIKAGTGEEAIDENFEVSRDQFMRFKERWLHNIESVRWSSKCWCRSCTKLSKRASSDH